MSYKATYTPAETKTEVVIVKPAQVTLTMTEEAAATLLQICSKIGGDPLTTARGYTDLLKLALRDAGVKEATNPIDHRRGYANSIYFADAVDD